MKCTVFAMVEEMKKKNLGKQQTNANSGVTLEKVFGAATCKTVCPWIQSNTCSRLAFGLCRQTCAGMLGSLLAHAQTHLAVCRNLDKALKGCKTLKWLLLERHLRDDIDKALRLAVSLMWQIKSVKTVESVWQRVWRMVFLSVCIWNMGEKKKGGEGENNWAKGEKWEQEKERGGERLPL